MRDASDFSANAGLACDNAERRYFGLHQFLTMAFMLLLMASLAACGGRGGGDTIGDGQGVTMSSAPENDDRSLFGFGDDDEGNVPLNPGATGQLKVGVNIYLWRAALDTLAFMPMLDSDAYGGVIITDWYADPGAPTERFKITVYVLDGRLRADGLQLSVFRQAYQPSGVWIDSAVSPETITKLENAILTRARNIRIAELGQ